MTNRIALWVGSLLILSVLFDATFNGSQNLLFLGKRLFELIDWVAFWR